MPLARFTVLLIPQASVAMAYLQLQGVVAARLGSAAVPMRYGSLTDIVVVIAFGMLTLTGNALIAFALLKIAAKLDGRRVDRRREVAAPFAEWWPGGPEAPVRPGAVLRAC